MIFGFILSTQANAAWENFVTCNKNLEFSNGEFAIDRDFNQVYQGSPAYQLVLRGSLLRKFIEKDAIDSYDPRINNKGEFILTVAPYDGNLFGFIGIRPGLQRMYWIIFDSSSIELKAEIGGRPRTGSEVAQWFFRNDDCSIVKN